MKPTSVILASVALLLSLSAASAQTAETSGAASTNAQPDTDPAKGRLNGGGDPNLLKNGTGNAQSPAVPAGGAPTQGGSNPSSQ